VIQHDCREPLPGGSYDITYGHILLKFMPPEDQWKVVINSYNALNKGGLGLHFMNMGGKTEATSMLEDGYYDIPLVSFEKKLDEMGISYKRISVKSGADLQHNMLCWVLLK